jgi:phosphoribosyl 1,2-cyclic phosphodiesterase
MKFTVLGSGSTGNAILISTEKTNVLVDAGLSAREIVRRLRSVGVEPESLNAIIVTHEHGDHIGGLRALLSIVKCPVYVSGETEEAYYLTRSRREQNGTSEASQRREALNGRAVTIESTVKFRIGDLDFEPFSVPHDAVDNFGFVAKFEGVKIASLTDFGHITPLMKEKLRGCDAIIMESNHSIDMLRMCQQYPWSLKQRIMSRHGHLSNEDLYDWLLKDFDGSARHLVLVHLSQRANEPHLARIMAETALRERAPLFPLDTKITISSHKEPTEWIGF